MMADDTGQAVKGGSQKARRQKFGTHTLILIVMVWGLSLAARFHETRDQSLRTFSRHNGTLGAMAFAPDSQTIFSIDAYGVVKQWDVSSGKVLKSISALPEQATEWYQSANFIYSAAFSHDGRILMFCCVKDVIRIVDLRSGELLERPESVRLESGAIAISPDSKFALSAGDAIRYWRIGDDSEPRSFQTGFLKELGPVAFSPDGKQALSGSDGADLILWDVATGEEIQRFQGRKAQQPARTVVFSPDSAFAVTVERSVDNPADPEGDTITIWDTASGRIRRILPGHSYGTFDIAISSDSRTILSGGGDHVVKLWDVATGEELTRLSGHPHSIDDVAFSPDGRFAVSAGPYEFKLWPVSQWTQR